MSSQPCGCDPEAHWVCDRHREEMREALLFHDEMDRAEALGQWQGQSKTESAAESTANLLAGFLLALFIQFTLYPFLGILISAKTNLLVVLIFSVTSILRSYIIRRIFNRFQ